MSAPAMEADYQAALTLLRTRRQTWEEEHGKKATAITVAPNLMWVAWAHRGEEMPGLGGLAWFVDNGLKPGETAFA